MVCFLAKKLPLAAFVQESQTCPRIQDPTTKPNLVDLSTFRKIANILFYHYPPRLQQLHNALSSYSPIFKPLI